MDPPQKFFTGDSKNRKRLKLLVGLRLGRAPAVVHLTGSKYAGCPDVPAYATGGGDDSRDMTAREYIAAIEAVLQQLGFNVARKSPRGRPVLCHDRCPAHKSHLVTEYLKSIRVHNLMLPPRSPDLDPLDYGVFGPAKLKMLKARVGAAHLSWDEACAWFVQHLKQLNTDNTVLDFERRLKACKMVAGDHFEHRLSELVPKPPQR